MITTTPCSIVDFHHHVADMGHILGTGSSAEHAGDPRVAFMDAHGIDQAIILPSSVGVTAETAATLNDRARAYAQADPERFPAFLATCDPTDPGRSVEEIDRAVEAGARGVVWHHHFQGTVVDDPRMDPLIQRLGHHGIPALVHVLAESFLEAPWRLQALARRFPEVEFVALDGFSSGPQAQQVLTIARDCPNLSFDTGVSISVAHGFRRFVEEIGPHRLLLGTDYYSSPPLFSIPFPLYELLNLGLDDEALSMVLGGNARRLLGLPAGEG